MQIPANTRMSLTPLEHTHEPILARAAEGLAKLTTSDADRIVRLVVRRCSRNLLEAQGNQVHVQFWGLQGLADLKPFSKSHRLARREIGVVLRDRKDETVTTLTCDSLLYGVPLATDFDIELAQNKWERRFVNESRDLDAAPGTRSGFAWNGLPDGSIPRATMKSAWRRVVPVSCLNCSGETFLMNFGLRQMGLFNRVGFVEHVWGVCRRSFRDEAVDVKA